MVGCRATVRPESACPPPDRQENPYLWNKFADGKLLFRNVKLLEAVRGNEKKTVQEFWRLLALCHTVMAQEKDSESVCPCLPRGAAQAPMPHHMVPFPPDQLLYQAASPDEEALVTAARNFGYVFLARTRDSITVLELGEERVYQVLAMMDFNSVRKRMSVLGEGPQLGWGTATGRAVCGQPVLSSLHSPKPRGLHLPLHQRRGHGHL